MSKTQYKKLLRKDSEDSIIHFINSSVKYLENLYCLPPEKDVHIKENFIPIIQSTYKTGFIGFIITLKSVENLFNYLIKSNNLDTLLIYKLSQDHL